MLGSNVRTRVRPFTYSLTGKESHQEDKEPAAALVAASSKQHSALLCDLALLQLKWRLASCTQLLWLPGFLRSSWMTGTRGEEEKCFFKRFSQSLMLFITSQQLQRGVAACNCSHRSFGPKTTNQDGFLFPLRRLSLSESCDLEMGHYLTWTWSDVKKH